MKKWIAFTLTLVLSFCGLFGCSGEPNENETSQEGEVEVSSTPLKDEVELALDGTLWQVNGQLTYLLFHGDKEFSEYDLSLLDEETQEVEKCLSYAIETDAKNEKAIYFPYLLGENDLRFQYQLETKTLVPKDKAINLKQVSVKSFIEEYMQRIENASKNKNWETQAEMNIATGIRCNYWDTLYEAIARYLQATLSEEDYASFDSQTQTFKTARQTAMDEAGKEVEGGSMYPVVTGGAYCTETEKQIQKILTEYFS